MKEESKMREVLFIDVCKFANEVTSFANLHTDLHWLFGLAWQLSSSLFNRAPIYACKNRAAPEAVSNGYSPYYG
jgi:hypothetical protein